MYNPTKPYIELIEKETAKTRDSRWASMTEHGFIQRKFVIPTLDVDHTDGIGTKGIFHWKCRTFHNAVLDALAMNINDLYMSRATPYKLQNHIFLPKEDHKAIAEIAHYLTKECLDRQILISGGECAIHDDSQGMEISITMSGFVTTPYTNSFKKGDVLVGLASHGIHSNGFSLIRKLMLEHGTSKLPFRDSWLNPTRIYVLPNSPFDIGGCQHITGGAFTKLKKRLKALDAYIYRDHDLEPQEDFQEIYRCTYSNEMMYSNFNCGIGMILSVNSKAVDRVIGMMGGEPIGEIMEGTGAVHIESKFNKGVVSL